MMQAPELNSWHRGLQAKVTELHATNDALAAQLDGARAIVREAHEAGTALAARLAEAEAIIEELCAHEGAEGWSQSLNERLIRFFATDGATVSAIDDRKVSIAPSVAELWVCDCGWKNIDREGVCFACQKPRATSTVPVAPEAK